MRVHSQDHRAYNLADRSPFFDPPQVLNEHTFIISENLLCFLQQQQSEQGEEQPLFLGHRLTLEDGSGTAFLSGGWVGR